MNHLQWPRTTNRFVAYFDRKPALLRGFYALIEIGWECNTGVGDLAFWSSMTWGGHWRERIGVEIARGVARCVEKAATGGRWVGSGAASGRHHELDRDCC
eukprot:COSAG02_NODE_4464_length_5334_cov_9.211652_1_plen_100_part_00